jgi:hypothetical protein
MCVDTPTLLPALCTTVYNRLFAIPSSSLSAQPRSPPPPPAVLILLLPSCRPYSTVDIAEGVREGELTSFCCSAYS